MNNNHALTASNLLASLPQVLQDDKSMAALAQSIADVLEKRMDEVRSVSIYPRIDELPEDLLDILAQDFKVDWWDASYGLEKKRELLKNSWHVHRILGTKEAVATALSTIYTNFKILEWWEYGGEPGCFMVQTSSFQMIDDNLSLFLATLEKVKRLSAHLEKVNIVTDVHETIGVGVACQLHLVKTFVMDEISLDDYFQWLTDENGNSLTDENGKIIVE